MSFYSDKANLIDGGLAGGHLPHTDLRIGVASEQSVAVGGPGERDAGCWQSFGLGIGHGQVELELVNNALTLEVPDADALVGSSAEPVPVRGEAQVVDDVALLAWQRVQPLALVEVPQHSHTILAARGAQGAVRGHSHGVDVAGVPDEVGAKLAVGQLPHLDELVPAARHDEWVRGVRGERHTGDPLAVALAALVASLDGVLALTKGVPQLDSFVAGAREAELAIGGDDHVLHEVPVAAEGPPWVPVGAVLAGQLPHHHGLVTRSGQDHVGVLGGGGDGRHPPRVSLETAAHGKVALFGSHGRYFYERAPM